jgi:hypothetical protein
MNKIGIVVLTSITGLLALGHSSSAQPPNPTSTLQASRSSYPPPTIPPGTPWTFGSTVTVSGGAYYSWKTSKVLFQATGGSYSTTPLVQNLNVNYLLSGTGSSGSTFVGIAPVPSNGNVKAVNTGVYTIPGGQGGGGSTGPWLSTSPDYMIVY